MQQLANLYRFLKSLKKKKSKSDLDLEQQFIVNTKFFKMG